MSETSYADLPELARKLRSVLAEKAQMKPHKSPFVLLYAFNGTGKTRLSTAFKDLGKMADENGEVRSRDTLYFNAFKRLKSSLLFLAQKIFKGFSISYIRARNTARCGARSASSDRAGTGLVAS